MSLLLMLLACAGPALPDPRWYTCEAQDTGPAHPRAEAFEGILTQGLAAGSVAVSAAVIDADGTWVGAAGDADLAQGVAAEPCHRFYFASVTKMFAASTALRMAEEGAWDLDTLARDHLPDEVVARVANLDIDDTQTGVTLRQLLMHRSGIPDYLSVPYFMAAFNGELHGAPAAEELEWAYGRDALYAPGGGYTYANSNYLLLSLAMEQVSGRPAYAQVASLVTEPLGLDATQGRSEADGAIARGYGDLHGHGHLIDQTELTEGVMLGEGKLDGGIVSTPLDVARLLTALAEGALLTPESFAEMSDFAAQRDGLEDGYGLGLTHLDTPYGPAWGHYGGVYPYQSAAFYFPDQGRAVVVVVSGFTAEVSAWMEGEAVFSAAL